MKSKLIILSLAVILSMSYSPYILADEGDEHKISDRTIMNDDGMVQEQADAAKAVEVGNKICPVSGNPVPAPGEKSEMGEAVKYEYNGKIYNLCCSMCVKDFKKNPEKYSNIADDEVAKEKEKNYDPHLDHNHNNS